MTCNRRIDRFRLERVDDPDVLLPFWTLLPPDISIEIIKLYLKSTPMHLHNLARLSRVNKALRELVVSTPEFWTTIWFSQSLESMTYAVLCMQRSQQCLLDVTVYFKWAYTPDHMDLITGMICAAAPRAKFLIIDMPTYDLLNHISDTIEDLEMPHLRELELTYNPNLFHAGPDYDSWLPSAPNLRVLKLLGVTNPTSMTYPLLEVLHIGPGRITFDQFEPLATAANLKEIGFDGCTTGETLDELWRPLHLPHVTFFGMINCDGAFFSAALANMDLPSLDTIHIMAPSRGFIVPRVIDWSALPRSSFPSVRMVRYTHAPPEDTPEPDSETDEPPPPLLPLHVGFHEYIIESFPNAENLALFTGGTEILRTARRAGRWGKVKAVRIILASLEEDHIRARGLYDAEAFCRDIPGDGVRAEVELGGPKPAAGSEVAVVLRQLEAVAKVMWSSPRLEA